MPPVSIRRITSTRTSSEKAQYLQKKYAEAKQSFTTATKLKPDFEAAYFNLGLTNKALGSNDDALASFRQALKIKPDYAKAHIESARILDRKNDFSGASASYAAALKIEPSNASALRELGALYSKSGKISTRPSGTSREALTLGADDAMDELQYGGCSAGARKAGYCARLREEGRERPKAETPCISTNTVLPASETTCLMSRFSSTRNR